MLLSDRFLGFYMIPEQVSAAAEQSVHAGSFFVDTAAV
jgi:hypothetical protein